jgi:dolichol-phosphate mannosyltransferase
MGISVALLAYKEEENLRLLLPEIKEAMSKIDEPYEILVIDTKEPLDNTEQVCKSNGAKYFNQSEPFFGGALREAIKNASMDKFLILDSDGSHDPAYIPQIYEAFISGADMAIGSRYIPGGVSNDSKSSKIMSKILNALFRLAIGVKAKDLSTDYRMYHTQQIKEIDLYCDNYDILQEIILKLKINKKSLIIKEIPIIFNKRIYGESKRSLIKFIFSYIKTIVKLTALRIISGKKKDNKKSEKQAELITNVILYGIIGVIAAIIDFGIFTLFNAATNSRIPEMANVIGAVTGFFVSFSLNTFFNFEKKDRLMFRFVSYGLVCLFGAFLTTTIIHFLKDLMNLSLLKIICICGVSIIQFILNKLITYSDIKGNFHAGQKKFISK